ncbi:MAG: DNA polymerase III subunit delta' [Rhodobacter sp.]|uniref:DNA polymerase III subunit delta' n=1 Tax=Pararhodobacter sp. TaxID=2127056 RepID=UPI001DD22477|nr:DNA polymerase III subunit delta' [Pararhodobacter sp.]MCB1344221.1 DNA polymerase III subunit delta' [Paracoccaceae bacterium]MCC0073578.1 DNA polymerase III subunit delta' [Rhodobacter sp.]HPD93675.1 DNA polymerase III subunit delta' [Pararhodobacter sp.]
MADTPEPDRVEGAPHPRDTPRLFGQNAAEDSFLRAFGGGRLHHGWLITGPRGVGKATLAWRIARFLLTQDPGGGLFGPPETLDVSSDHPVAHRIQAGAEPGLLVIRRGADDKTGKLRSQITVDEVRKLRDFFGLSSAEGGRRVVLVDAADEMNANAANALLKLLEEPPAGASLLLVAHQPSRLLPTIRSRCRELRLAPLGPEDMGRALGQALGHDEGGAELAELSGGSVGEAIRLLAGGGLALYADIVALLAEIPRLSRPELLKLCNSMIGKDSELRFDLTVRLVDLALARLARTGATGTPPAEATPGEARVLTRLAPDARAARIWAEQASDLGARARGARAVNLDPGALVLDMFLRLESAARMAAG